MRGDQGPPGRERPGATPDTGPIQKSADTTTDKPIICHAGVAEWLRRHRATERLMPLCRCGPDPWLRRRRPQPPLTDHAVDGWHATAQHLLDVGCTPMLPPEALRALYRRGGRDRLLAERLHQACGEVAS
jgi:hypothetical protein